MTNVKGKEFRPRLRKLNIKSLINKYRSRKETEKWQRCWNNFQRHSWRRKLSIMCNPATLLPFERMFPSSLQIAIKFSFMFCPVFVETSFSGRVGIITASSCYRNPSQVFSRECMVLPSAEVERAIGGNRLYYPLSFYPS